MFCVTFSSGGWPVATTTQLQGTRATPPTQRMTRVIAMCTHLMISRIIQRCTDVPRVRAEGHTSRE